MKAYKCDVCKKFFAHKPFVRTSDGDHEVWVGTNPEMIYSSISIAPPDLCLECLRDNLRDTP